MSISSVLLSAIIKVRATREASEMRFEQPSPQCWGRGLSLQPLDGVLIGGVEALGAVVSAIFKH